MFKINNRALLTIILVLLAVTGCQHAKEIKKGIDEISDYKNLYLPPLVDQNLTVTGAAFSYFDFQLNSSYGISPDQVYRLRDNEGRELIFVVAKGKNIGEGRHYVITGTVNKVAKTWNEYEYVLVEVKS